jgi:hypothetical protein
MARMAQSNCRKKATKNHFCGLNPANYDNSSSYEKRDKENFVSHEKARNTDEKDNKMKRL